MPENARARRDALRKRLVNPHPVLYAFAIMCDGKSKTTVMNSDFDATVAAAIAAKAQPTDRVHIWKYIQMGKAATVCLALLLAWSLGMAQVQKAYFTPAPDGRYTAQIQEADAPAACWTGAVLEGGQLETAFGDKYDLCKMVFHQAGNAWYYAGKRVSITLTPAPPLSDDEGSR
jgi:hypothetical protein